MIEKITPSDLPIKGYKTQIDLSKPFQSELKQITGSGEENYLHRVDSLVCGYKRVR